MENRQAMTGRRRADLSSVYKVILDLGQGAEGIVTAELVPILVKKLQSEVDEIKCSLDGKNKAVEVESVGALVKLLKDETPDVRAGATMMITITTKGKYTAIKDKAITPLVELVDDTVSEVRLNALKIRKRTEDEIPAVVKAAEIAVKVITWKP